VLKASDFDFKKDLIFDMKKGITSFKDSRLVIFDANAIGLLRQSLIETLGWEKAREIFLKFGFQNGYSDFIQMKLAYKFENDMELLASGPVIHTWEGIVHANPKEIEFNKEKGEIYFSGIWSNSYEAEQHLTFGDISNESTCWTLMGYASGWTSAFMGNLIICIEPVCVGKGDDHCEWLLRNVSAWDSEVIKPHLNAYKEYKVGG
jgi:hypothetical protein